MNENLELTISRIIPAAPETVFEAWLDPMALAKFIKPMAGMSDCDVEVDAREGGEFLIIMKAGERDMPHHGRYKTIKRYEKIVFTWVSERSIPDSTVTLTFEESGPSDTRLTLHHAGFADEGARNSHEGGWGAIIEQLFQFVGATSN